MGREGERDTREGEWGMRLSGIFTGMDTGTEPGDGLKAKENGDEA
jgi:hypothetical protein